MRSDYVNNDIMSHILAALTEPNRLAVLVSLTTGLRIDDVLNIRVHQLRERFTVTEQKTLKHRTVRLPERLLNELVRISGKIFVFEGRTIPRRHRTRQAVYKDIKRAAKAFRVPSAVNISCHTARKIYAVNEYKRTCDIKRIQTLLNHSSEAVTMIYALADNLTAKHLGEKEKKFC